METRRLTKKPYGLVKQAVIDGHAAGLTYAEVAAKHGFKRESLWEAARRLGINLKPSKHIK